MTEGYLTSCTFDYMADNLETKIFVFLLWIWCWIMPLGVIIFSYGKITTQVMTHEARLKEQVKTSTHKISIDRFSLIKTQSGQEDER